ncbi:HdeD family acid-resistance protein [Sphaerisporangium album]|uniref:HdeD family acid-resistance protein n=1 Tax=Sphaerisporangium album TaxID=509200 RepID=A0A367FAW0_9ACTN|nr:HdeD family acid-resistance protein [Sphaerisporangium album]RCG27401.1 HdeD family acid-resistance protein [Sphaerisporangium album]
MRDVSGQAAPGLTGRDWWVLAVRGACAIVFGILAIIWPLITLLTLVILFGIFAIVSGIFTLIGAFRGDHPRQSKLWMIVSGVLGIIAGVIAWVWPGITAFALLMLIAAYAVVIGVSEIVAAVRRRASGETEWMWLVSGVLAVIFGILLFIWPAPGALALTWLIGVFAIVYGVSLLVLAYRVHDIGHRGTAGTAAHAM